MIKVRTGWPYRWFWKFFYGLAKSPRVLRSSWMLNERNLYCKIMKYCILLSEVCMIKTVPHGTVSPQMWCINDIKGWFTPAHPDLLARLCKLVERKKIRPDFFFSGLINIRWSRAIMALKCDRRWLPAFWCTWGAVNSK